MSLKIGIVGLPNVGKSTIFNALVKGSHAEAANYPFCTIEPNVGIVEVPDERLKALTETSKSLKTIPAVIEFVDIAGLVRGASKGEGLGNQFLAHIRECDALAIVTRFFEDENIVHVDGKISPIDDIKTIQTELQLADIATVEKRFFSIEKELKSGSKSAVHAKEAIQKIKDKLFSGHDARDASLSDKEKESIKEIALLTQKPVLYIANCSEEDLANFEDKYEKESKDYSFIPISAKLESELNELSEDEKREYLDSLGIKDSGFDRLVKEAYKSLGLITYFTSGEKETRAWTIKDGFSAPQAAGVIHTDFEKGFIAAEVIPWQDLFAQGSWSQAKSQGLVKTEGKTYIVKDGDVMIFRFNV